ncbi:NAD(P)H-dependent oxidoreductase subunit E [Aquabacterium sp.]|uniref:NAD(P)H-dependent oxidoreductase subunit E n=1 Tax=Aquabacterium sp. TaxID=1872578 RepID=UPI003BB2000E
MTSTLFQKQRVQTLIAAHADQPGALLPLLHSIQDNLGFIPGDTVEDIAKGLNLSRAEVHGVITYYHHFRSEAPAKTVVQICRAEACQSCGSEALYAQAQSAVDGCHVEGAIALEAAYCLGLCASSPAIQVNDRLHARVTPAALRKLLNQAGVV